MPSSSPAVAEPYRCHRGHRCEDREPVFDATGSHTGWVGAELPTRDGLCGGCVSAVSGSLTHLPLDVVELTLMIGRAPEATTLETTRIALSAPGPRIPVRENVAALRALIDHEVDCWSRAVAYDTGEAWTRPRRDLRRSRIGYRVAAGCGFLRPRLSRLLQLGLVEHRARSATANRVDGHDEDTTTRYGDDYWTSRTGLEGALLLLDLHERAWALAGRSEREERMHLPCTTCGQLALFHDPGGDEVWCVHCRARTRWSDYQVLRDHTLIAHDAAV